MVGESGDLRLWRPSTPSRSPTPTATRSSASRSGSASTPQRRFRSRAARHRAPGRRSGRHADDGAYRRAASDTAGSARPHAAGRHPHPLLPAVSEYARDRRRKGASGGPRRRASAASSSISAMAWGRSRSDRRASCSPTDFMPDCISSDVHALCIEGPAFDLVTTMSKFLCLGMPLTEVIHAATERPANALQRPDLGTLKPGSAGDATLLALEEGQFAYRDSTNAELSGRLRLSARRGDRRHHVAPGLTHAASRCDVIPSLMVPLFDSCSGIEHVCDSK